MNHLTQLYLKTGSHYSGVAPKYYKVLILCGLDVLLIENFINYTVVLLSFHYNEVALFINI